MECRNWHRQRVAYGIHGTIQVMHHIVDEFFAQPPVVYALTVLDLNVCDLHLSWILGGVHGRWGISGYKL